MFERFTDRARRVVVLAQENARSLNHTFIGTEHFLLALLNEGTGIAARTLQGLGVEYEAVRRNVEETVGRGKTEPSGHVPFTPRAKAILESALQECRGLGHNHIDTEHLLLGLLREGDGLGVKILVRLGASPAMVRAQVLDLTARQDRGEDLPGAVTATAATAAAEPDLPVSPLGRLRGFLGGDRERDAADAPDAPDAPAGPGGPARSAGAARPAGAGGAGGRRVTRVSRELKWRDPVSVSLSEWARRGQLDPLIGRRELADQLLATVCRRNGNNALLVGESGVGKTALISGLVNTITAGREHGPLSGTEVWQIPHVALWTASVNTLLDPAADPVLLVVEDLDLLLVEDRPGSGYAAATLNAICHGPRPVVATVSPGGYADLATISGQFQRIDVPPTDAAETVAILTGLRGLYQEHHGVTITDEAIAAAPVLAADYLPQRRFPGAAVGLIDTAGARLKVAGGAGPAVVDERFLAEVARGLADGQRDVGGRDIR